MKWCRIEHDAAPAFGLVEGADVILISAVSEYETKNMIFSLAHYIARMTRYITLDPGDVLWMGCDGATLPPLEDGDLVEVVNDAIGVLADRVVREKA